MRIRCARCVRAFFCKYFFFTRKFTWGRLEPTREADFLCRVVFLPLWRCREYLLEWVSLQIGYRRNDSSRVPSNFVRTLVMSNYACFTVFSVVLWHGHTCKQLRLTIVCINKSVAAQRQSSSGSQSILVGVTFFFCFLLPPPLLFYFALGLFS